LFLKEKFATAEMREILIDAHI